MITSSSNSQVKNIIQLNSKGKARREQDIFVVEGIRMFREAPRDRIVKAYVSEHFFQEEEHKRLLESCSYEVVEDRLFRTLSDTMTPQGILCLVKQYHYQMEELLRKEKPCIMVLENLQDPGNLGTIFRTAEGAGVSGILMNRGCVDIYNPKTIRSTMGAIYRMPFLYTDDLPRAVTGLKSREIPVFAAHLGGTLSYDETDYRNGCAFLIGNEGNGLTDETAVLADTYIRIPMEGQVESLNAGVAASLLMYEAYRQKRNS
ncbi:MAG: RNA methyltransferase [Lachnospiraceae bacterium]|nr:RNA methyltransferase [Lachnospiraceae bacterium]MDY5540518.1 RNA methyltransferase [Lachnospiraceae bacterium]